MKTKKIWANLAVDDVERTHMFYKELGFRPNGEFSKENELASFLVGEDDFVDHFFSKDISLLGRELLSYLFRQPRPCPRGYAD